MTRIDPFSIQEPPHKVEAAKAKAPVQPATDAPDTLKREADEGKLINLIEEAERRAKKRRALGERRRRGALRTYTKVGFLGPGLQDRGKKLDTRG